MPDLVIGTAILFEEDGLEMLMLRLQCGNGDKHSTNIPVYPRGGKKVRTHQWEYVKDGETLHITPSLNWVGVFHNSGAWSVKFQQFDPARSKWQYPGDQFREVNGLQK